MADNTIITAMSGGDTIQTDDSTAGYKTQVVKVAFGADSTAPTRVQSSAPLPTYVPDLTATGNITTQNLVPAGTATAGSTVTSPVLNGAGTVGIQVTGTYTGALTPQVTIDGANWVTVTPTVGGLSGALVKTSNGLFGNTIASATQDIFTMDVSGYARFRVSANAAVTGTATVSIQVGGPQSPGSRPIAVTQSSNNNLLTSAVGGTTPGNAVGNATQTMASAQTALPTATTNGKGVLFTADKVGRTVVVHNGMRDIVSPAPQLVLTATTTETLFIAATASVFHDLLQLTVCNESLTTGTRVDFRDSTGGTIRTSVFVPAGSTVSVPFYTPMPQNAVNTAWTAQCGTSVSSITVTGIYVSNS